MVARKAFIYVVNNRSEATAPESPIRQLMEVWQGKKYQRAKTNTWHSRVKNLSQFFSGGNNLLR